MMCRRCCPCCSAVAEIKKAVMSVMINDVSVRSQIIWKKKYSFLVFPIFWFNLKDLSIMFISVIADIYSPFLSLSLSLSQTPAHTHWWHRHESNCASVEWYRPQRKGMFLFYIHFKWWKIKLRSPHTGPRTHDLLFSHVIHFLSVLISCVFWFYQDFSLLLYVICDVRANPLVFFLLQNKRKCTKI